MMLKYLLEKEIKQFVRNPFMPKLVFIMPCIMLLLLPWAADLSVKNVNLVVVDHDHTTWSGRLIRKATASEYFHLRAYAGSYNEAMEYIQEGSADIILEIPQHLERDLVRTGYAGVLISANTVNGTKGLLGSSYLARIVQSFCEELQQERGTYHSITVRSADLEVIPRIRYNPNLDYKKFMVPAFMVVLLTLIGGFLPALNVVMEKEIGTIEQINVTPVTKINFILAKLIPYWIMGFIVLNLSLLIAWVLYGIVPAGSLFTMYAAFVIYVIALSGFGIVISNHSGTMQQAMFIMFFFMIIFILMSGIFTPIGSMPGWAQKITLINPLRYFIQIMRSIFFKGSGIVNLYHEFLILVGFAVVSNSWAVISYRKRN